MHHTIKTMSAADQHPPTDRKLGKLYSMFVSRFKSKSRSNSEDEIHLPDAMGSAPPDVFGMSLNSRLDQKAESKAPRNITRPDVEPTIRIHSNNSPKSDMVPSRTTAPEGRARKISHDEAISQNRAWKHSHGEPNSQNRTRKTSHKEESNQNDKAATKPTHRTDPRDVQDMRELVALITTAQSSGHLKILRRKSTESIHMSGGAQLKLIF